MSEKGKTRPLAGFSRQTRSASESSTVHPIGDKSQESKGLDFSPAQAGLKSL
jgi:hypothetical protein